MSKTVFRPAPPLNRSKKWVIHTRPGDLGSKTAKQLYNSVAFLSWGVGNIWLVYDVRYATKRYAPSSLEIE